ncbi:hypothetical protein ACVRXQ_03585 [Streptococcus panodentis]|uniref:DUF1795 domain-containing protein n=1 Tax=Streptococcus panodentis TaxID=1581472 RepID=A0ABS5AZ22_9STRE|nr:hypothetical protein [Streptococcus panodentis]MBP2621839.1 hypothetical protein [Streptococcus panodentis]
MTLRTFPSAAFPALPSIRLEAASGWQDWNLPGSVLSLHKPQESGFIPNILMNIRTVDRAYDFAAYRAEIEDYSQGLDQFRLVSDGLHEVNGLQWQVVEYAYIDEVSGPLAQFLAAAFVESGSVIFMISFTGTVGLLGQAENLDYIDIRDVFRTVTIHE